MFFLFTTIIYASAFLLIVLSWIAGSKASLLLYGGSPERLNRKTRKQLVWSAIVAVPAVGIIAGTLLMANTMSPVFWEDRVYLHLPLVLTPLLATWLLAVPKLWKLWKLTSRSADAASQADIRKQSANPLIIVPFQMSALGAAVIFYFLLVTPVPLQPAKAIVPILLWAAASFVLWRIHDRRYRKIDSTDAKLNLQPWRRAIKGVGIFCVAAGIASIALVIESENSRLPSQLSMTEGPMDFGGGIELVHNKTDAMSVAMLTGPREVKPDRTFTLTAEKKTVTLASGKQIDVWSYNGQVPGPELRMKQGELVEVTLINKDIEVGATIHWHGLDVPNAEDGVAGATQDAVMPGGKHVYRFVAEQTGTFWYHSHQDSRVAVQMGLFGALIVEPAIPSGKSSGEDVTVITHVWDEQGLSIGMETGVQRKQITPGTPVRIRLINTQDWVRQKYVLAGTSFQVAALDGTDLHEPSDLQDTHLILTTGGRADLTFLMPDHPVFLSVGSDKNLGILLSRDGTGDIPDIPKTEVFDPIHYGTPGDTLVTANSDFDREFDLILDNKLGFYDGQFGSLYTMNGEVFPNTPMFMVQEGDLVKTTITNRGAVDHPMHLHGHHMLVLSYNGELATGSPWYSDTLDVQPGDTYEVGFVADNPGLWMDHCHNLTHAAVGMSMHLMYDGITSPYTVGTDTVNHPE
ncbi:multicopper oxidase family protein [Cohnella lupini]|uniref:FtsP/CotA-like multicopper oxidase with cupredoxin domain n=1 Tax=Cohnella lupini TaxID=1294267 RepID=A0A3D9I891_9BACL|nr:multicopper oxidase family protein [Cohnella lupini]RED58004.1 FtsP/CotA-like multicopper oxidase with cupredoxin domain [Cohnella lupini]